MLACALVLGCNVSSTTPLSVRSAEEDEAAFRGILRAGADLGEVKRHCAQGLYLVAREGTYLDGQTTMLLLRVAGDDGPPMFEDRRYLNQSVVVTGRHPVDPVSCGALICGCEDYLLLGSIRAQQP